MTIEQRSQQMNRYKNLSGNSSISSYEIGDDRITVQYSDGMNYLYTNLKTGAHNIDQMKRLAVLGQGLNTYIHKHVKNLYEKKWR